MVIKTTQARPQADVRIFSRGGYAYGETGKSDQQIGLIPFLTLEQATSLIGRAPDGTPLYITDTQQAVLVDSTNGVLIPLGGGLSTISGVVTGSGLLGLPDDGSFLDGVLPLNPSGTVATAIDALNEYLLGCGCLELASHLGTTDGNTDGRLQAPTFVQARVSTPNLASPFLTNSWDNDTNRNLTNINSFTWNLISGESITDLQQGPLEARFYDGSNTLIYSEVLNPDGTVNNQASTPSGILSINNLVELAGKVQGRLDVTVPHSTLLSSNTGYLRVEVDHTVSPNIYSETVEFFFDSETGPSIIAQGVGFVNSPLKFLSGVKYATISGLIRPQISFSAEALDVWKDTYRVDPLLVNSATIGVPNYSVAYNSVDVTKDGVSPPVAPFEHDDDFAYSGVEEITQTNLINPDEAGIFASVSYTIRDPFYSSTGVAITPNILINTYGNVSTDVLELFVDEDYRLIENSGVSSLGSINGSGRAGLAWDSSQSLVTYSGLQVINGSLIYPQSNFLIYEPSTNPNYTAISGLYSDLVYVRRFRDTLGTARTNGVLYIPGFTEADRLAKNIKVELRVVETHVPGNPLQSPGNFGTGWLSLNDNYNIATFTGDDGDGCYVNTGSFSDPFYEFTLGSFSTAFAANNAIELRVTYKNPIALNKRITRIEIINWNG